jgi:hypothetical protein
VVLLVVVLAALFAGHVRGGSDDRAPTGTSGRHGGTAVQPVATASASGSRTRSPNGAGPYTGGWHESLGGNQVPDDCRAWARSSGNPASHADGLDRCESGG